MSGNPKQTGGGPQTRYPYQPIPPPQLNSTEYHQQGYVPQNQGPPPANQGMGQRTMQASVHPNQSSTPPTADLKVQNIQAGMQQMQFVQNQGRSGAIGQFYAPRNAGGGPPANAAPPRLSNPQHRAQSAQMYFPQLPFVIPGPAAAAVYFNNNRPTNNMIPPQPFQPPIFQQNVYPFPPAASAQSVQYPSQLFLYQRAVPSNPQAPVNGNAANMQNPAGVLTHPPQPINPQPQTYSRTNNPRQRRSKAIPIIDPSTGNDRLEEVFREENASHPPSGETSARQTPQLSVTSSKEVQATFAKQVAQAINEDRLKLPHQENAVEALHIVDAQPHRPLDQEIPPAQINHIPSMYDIENSNLTCDAKEFVSASSVVTAKPQPSQPQQQQQHVLIGQTPIVSANTDAAEVVLAKKEQNSPAKGRGKSQKEPAVKVESAAKEYHHQAKETEKIVECDVATTTRASAVKEEVVVAPVLPSQISQMVGHQTVIIEASNSKDLGKEDRKGGVKKGAAVPAEHLETPYETAASSNGKSKNARSKSHAQNGKQSTPLVQIPVAQVTPAQPLHISVPVSQPPKANNKSSKSKELNMKGANKEGTDMDAFNDNTANNAKHEINANVEPAKAPRPSETSSINNKAKTEKTQPISTTTITTTTATPVVSSENEKTNSAPSELKKVDSNENVTDVKSESLISNINNGNANVVPSVAPSAPVVASIPAPSAAPTAPVAPKPQQPKFDVTSIIKEPTIAFPPRETRDEPDRAVVAQTNSKILAKNEVNTQKSYESSVRDFYARLRYAPDQWSPSNRDGIKVYEKDFLFKLRESPLSQIKPPTILDVVSIDERTRQMEGRPSMGGRSTDFMNPPFHSYGGGKSGSQSRSAVTKRGSQSGGKMGSRSGDKNAKPQPKVSISLRGEVKLHEVENAWKPARFNKGENMTEEEVKSNTLLRKFRAILNKLTPEKFDRLLAQVKELSIDTKPRLQGIIDLMFEKAIEESSFSVAYAKLCKELQNLSVPGDQGKPVALKTLLITRCQMEFEKSSVDEAERNKKVKEIEECTDPEKKKELLADLDEHDTRLRKKSVGTIRFIGELFKQQMLTSNIVRRCLVSLLTTKEEESLECFCKLLTTVGKELEQKHGVNLNDIFNDMKPLSEGKGNTKVSSRIRFMLQDVIDLRNSGWIPRRQDANPKTIDQIQKEAENEHLTMQAMISHPPYKDDRRGGSGGGGGGGSSNSNSRSGGNSRISEDGWNPVDRKNNRQTTFSIQTDKIQAGAKLDTGDQLLGSSQLFDTWGKGAQGTNKSSFPHRQPFSNNMYTALEHAGDLDKRPPNSRSGSNYASKGPSMERYKNQPYDGRGSRNGSQHRDAPVRQMQPPAPPPSRPAPVPAAAPPAAAPAAAPPSVATGAIPKLTETQIVYRIKISLDEYVSGACTSTEFFQDVFFVLSPESYHRIVYESYNYVLEKSQTDRQKTSELFAYLVKVGHLSIDDFIKGFEELLTYWEDLIIDIPQIWQNYADNIAPLIIEEVLTYDKLQRLLKVLIDGKVAQKLLAPLFSIVVKEKGPNFLVNNRCWPESGPVLTSFMPEQDINHFVTANKLEFLLTGSSGDTPVRGSLSFDEIKTKLLDLFKRKSSFDAVVDWITKNVGPGVTENTFIRALATAIFEDSIYKSKLQTEVLRKHTLLFQKYVDNKPEFELQCLYALQALVHRLEHPQGLLLAICDKLYELETFSQESFTSWEISTDPAEQEGKGVALKQLTSFFTQLKETESSSDEG